VFMMCSFWPGAAPLGVVVVASKQGPVCYRSQ
jgi:hypothetical protein